MNTLFEMLSYPFLARAIIVGLLISICAGLLGVNLVLKKYSMIGDGLSHVGFGALAIATAFEVEPLMISIPIVLIAAFFLLKLNENNQIKADSAIALVSTSSLAFGIFVISKVSKSNVDLSSYMFGSILSINKNDLYMSILLAIVVISLFFIFYHQIFAITFDEDFSKASGIKIERYHLLISSLTAVTIVIGMRIMGTLLMSSFIIFPAMSAMRITKNFKSTILLATFLSIICFLIGITLSYIYSLPSGATIVIVHLVFFIFLSISKKVFK